MNTSIVYLLGFLLVIGGLAYGALTAGVPQIWVIIGAVVLFGVALMSTVKNTRRPAPSGDEEIIRTTTVRRD
ncbi:hypothetical protein EYB45_05390 [Erythrobacteraceae bacterium CFH 75059]|uniref:hypothetical protein n=1 Tax=Qipengyuania thermophila TaxID=2509361 RepID=UPI00101F7AE9|nr:hypothetical protein [Qipengyuania thermophila]TCD04968.1 hypothetical protein EYB45_05390 [Erythrobacteraceae bacterium CFH 75059]